MHIIRALASNLEYPDRCSANYDHVMPIVRLRYELRGVVVIDLSMSLLSVTVIPFMQMDRLFSGDGEKMMIVCLVFVCLFYYSVSVLLVLICSCSPGQPLP